MTQKEVRNNFGLTFKYETICEKAADALATESNTHKHTKNITTMLC